MKYLFIPLLWGLFSSFLFSQVSGKVTDAETSKALTGAHVVLYDTNGVSQIEHAVTGKHGEFIFEGSFNQKMILSVSYLGYKIYRSEINPRGASEYLTIELEPSVVPVGEVTVSAVRREKNLINVSMPVSIVNSSDIDRRAGFTAADMLKNEPGLFLARDGIWATSLNIRGLTEQRVVTLVDGNRVETATDIAAGMAMIDVNDIRRIEVIKGSASSLYGTGALGGVVNIITKQGHYSPSFYAEGEASGSYQTVNHMHSEHASAGIGSKKWYLRISGTYRDAENTLTPEGELENSQFTDNNLSVKLGAKPIENHEIKINYQRFYAKDVGIPGGEAFPALATATYPEELRDMFSVSYRIFNDGKIFRDLEMKYFHQYILRDVILKPSPAVTVSPSGYHTTNGVQLQSSLNLLKDHSFITGIDVWQRHLDTEREKNIYQPVFDSVGNQVGTKHIIRGEVPIPESLYTSAGYFINDEFKTLNDRLKIVAGARFDLIHVQNEMAVDPLYMIVNDNRMDNPPNQRITFAERDVFNYSWSADLGLIFGVGKDMDITGNFSRAFRSPSIEERYKYIDLGNRVLIGDPELKPEDGYFSDLGIRLWKDDFHFSLNGFANSLSNLIVGKPGEVIYNYTGDSGMTDTIPAVINANVDKALLYGFDMSFNYNFTGRFTLFGTAAYVRGIDRKNDLDLPSIPPMNGRLGLQYKGLRWVNAEIVSNLYAAQEKIAEGETETSAYAYYDFRINTLPVELGFTKISLYAGVENFTDRAYINHLASNRGVIKYEPGRNFYVKLNVRF